MSTLQATWHPILDAIAVQGVGYIKNRIRAAFTDGRNLEPRVYALADANMAINPIHMNEEKIRKLLRKALSGRL